MAGSHTLLRSEVGSTTMRSRWEQSCDGSNWETFWDVKASKAK
jgi:hypothetical protein